MLPARMRRSVDFPRRSPHDRVGLADSIANPTPRSAFTARKDL
jgi:hypothetical protein